MWVLLGTSCLLISTYLSQLLYAATCCRRKHLLLFLQLGIDTSCEHILSTCPRAFSQLWKIEYWWCKWKLRTFTFISWFSSVHCCHYSRSMKTNTCPPFDGNRESKVSSFFWGILYMELGWDTYVTRNLF